MPIQIHKQVTDDQVKLLLDLYAKHAVTLKQVLQQLGCGRARFYQLLKKYRAAPERFTIAYARHRPQLGITITRRYGIMLCGELVRRYPHRRCVIALGGGVIISLSEKEMSPGCHGRLQPRR